MRWWHFCYIGFFPVRSRSHSLCLSHVSFVSKNSAEGVAPILQQGSKYQRNMTIEGNNGYAWININQFSFEFRSFWMHIHLNAIRRRCLFIILELQTTARSGKISKNMFQRIMMILEFNKRQQKQIKMETRMKTPFHLMRSFVTRCDEKYGRKS